VDSRGAVQYLLRLVWQDNLEFHSISARAVQYLLRLVWQDNLEFHSISASRSSPVSLFVSSGLALCACGVEMTDNQYSEIFMLNNDVAPSRSLGFGLDWLVHPWSVLRKEEPTLVPAAAGVRMRAVASGGMHGLALTNEGQLYMWGHPPYRLGFLRSRYSSRSSAISNGPQPPPRRCACRREHPPRTSARRWHRRDPLGRVAGSLLPPCHVS
jgi:hypothetical protein